MPEVVRYCAWCDGAKPLHRKADVFYTSTICKKHLKELRRNTAWKPKKEVIHIPKPEVETSLIEQKITTSASFDSVTTSAGIVS